MCVRVNVHAARIRERHSYLAKDIKRRRWTLSTQLEVANIVLRDALSRSYRDLFFTGSFFDFARLDFVVDLPCTKVGSRR